MMTIALQIMLILDILLLYMVGGEERGGVPLALNTKMYIMLGILFPHPPCLHWFLYCIQILQEKLSVAFSSRNPSLARLCKHPCDGWTKNRREWPSNPCLYQRNHQWNCRIAFPDINQYKQYHVLWIALTCPCAPYWYTCLIRSWRRPIYSGPACTGNLWFSAATLETEG